MPQGGFLWKNSVPAQPASIFLVYMGEKISGGRRRQEGSP